MNSPPLAGNDRKPRSLLRIFRALVDPTPLKGLWDIVSLYIQGGIIIKTRAASQDGGRLLASTLIQPDGDVVTQLDPEIFAKAELLRQHLDRLRTQCETLRLAMLNLRAAHSQYLWWASGIAVILEPLTSQSNWKVVRCALPFIAWRVFIAAAEASKRWNEGLNLSDPTGPRAVMKPVWFLLVPTLILAAGRYFDVIEGQIAPLEMLSPLIPALPQLFLSVVVPWLFGVLGEPAIDIIPAASIPLFFVWARVMVTAAFGEEVIFRGFLLPRLEVLFAGSPFAVPLAVIGQALIFGLLHYSSGPATVLAAGLIGLVFGAAYVLGGRNLWPLIVAHAITGDLVNR